MAADVMVPDAVLAEVARGGARDAALAVELLGEFLPLLVEAVGSGKPLRPRQLAVYEALGDAAARQGVALRALLDLYLSAAWRLWRHLPAVAGAAEDPQGVVVAGEVMLHACDDVVAALTEGYQLARRSLVRAQESARREFVDDLLTAGGDVAGLLQRADGFGLDLSGPHAVAVVTAARPFTDGTAVVAGVERAVQGSKGDADALVASKEGRLVVVAAAPDREATAEVVASVRRSLSSGGGSSLGTWQIGLSRPRAGADGVVSSYQEALDALDLAQRLALEGTVIDAQDLLVYHVLLRDRAAIVDLVRATLTPLLGARGGARPLLDTLAAYFESGGNAAHTARALHLSVRAVTYRLSRVGELIGSDPTLTSERFALHAAVLGAQLLGWPESALD